MEESFRQLIKEYFYFSKKDRRGIIVLGFLILFVICGIIVIERIQLSSDYDFSEFKKAIRAWEQETNSETAEHSLFKFDPNTISEQKLDSLSLPPFVKNNIVNYRKAGGKFNHPEDVRKIYGMNDSIFSIVEKYIDISEIPNNSKATIERKVIASNSDPVNFTGSFDPNTADSTLLYNFGFNSFQANNLIKYRQSGGFFTSPTDILRIYGVDSAFFSAIKNHIQIKTANSINHDFAGEKTKEPVISVELNAVDSVGLIQLPGIGSVFASRIIKYRDLLGGYYSVEQLLEVYNFPEETYSEIHKDISIDSTLIQQIRLNFADYTELLRHPYINKKQVEAILEYRNKNGPFRTIEDFEGAGIVDAEKVKQLKPYLTCR